MTSFIATVHRLLSRCGIQLDDDTAIVDVDTKWWYSAAMIICADMMCLIETSYATNSAIKQGGLGSICGVLSMLLSFVVGFIFLARSKYPECVFFITCLLVLIFPFDSIISTMALSSLLARRSEHRHSTGMIVLAAVVAVFAQLRDTFQRWKTQYGPRFLPNRAQM